MKKHIETMLKPFVTAVHNQLKDIYSQFKVHRYHYGYGPQILESNNWFVDFDTKHLDYHIERRHEGENTNIDIVLESHKSGDPNVFIRLDHTLRIVDDEFKIIATSTNVDGQYVITMDLINEKGVDELAKEFVDREIEANPIVTRN